MAGGGGGASLFNLTSNHLFQHEVNKYIRFWNTEFVSLASIGYKVGICLIGISFRYNLTIVQNHDVGLRLVTRKWISASTAFLRRRHGPLRPRWCYASPRCVYSDFAIYLLTGHECNIVCGRFTCFNTSPRTFYFFFAGQRTGYLIGRSW